MPWSLDLVLMHLVCLSRNVVIFFCLFVLFVLSFSLSSSHAQTMSRHRSDFSVDQQYDQALPELQDARRKAGRVQSDGMLSLRFQLLLVSREEQRRPCMLVLCVFQIS